MYKVPLKDIKEKIISSGKMSAEEIDNKIKFKINELSGLISEEGAAHIIANELGVVLVEKNDTQLKIKEIYAGMRDIITAGKVVQKYETREFARGNSTGKVCSIVIGDETATIRVVFWNDQVDQLSRVNKDDIVMIKEAYVRENRGGREIHLGDKGELEINPEGVTIENVREGTSYARKQIKEIQDGEEGIELLGTVVQVFDPRFWSTCPDCNKKVAEDNSCATHGAVTPGHGYVLNLVLDDGTGTIRGTFWKNQTNNLLGKTEEEMSAFKENPSSFESLKTDLLGEQVKVMGRVKKNDMFDRLEFNVQIVNKADPNEEIARLEKTE
jgi:replication factor A1